MSHKTVVSLAVEYTAVNGDTNEPITDEAALAKIDEVIGEYVQSAADGGLLFAGDEDIGEKITEDFAEKLICPEILNIVGQDGYITIEEITFTKST